MSILSILDMGRTALNVQRQALEVAGENVANVNTPGYSRQVPIMQTAPTAMQEGFPLGRGVEMARIQRSYDDFLQVQLKTENSTLGNQSTLQSSLQRIDQLFNEMNADTGMAKSLQDYFNAFQDLSMNPQGLPERQAVISRAGIVVDNFHRMSTFLTNIKNEANQSMTGIASDINDKTGEIASLNQQIKEIEVFGRPANELRDRRDLLIRDLSKIVGINSLEQSDGTVNITLLSGPQLVDGTNAGTVSLQPNGANSGYYDVMLKPPAGSTIINVSSIIGGPGNKNGTIGATMQIRDVTANNFLSRLDEMAFTLANQINNVHSAGFGLTGSTGINFFTPPAAMSGYSNIIAVNVTNSNDVAASSTDPTLAGNGTGNNSNALSLAAVRNISLAMSTGTTTLQGFYNSMVGEVGVAAQNAQRGTKQSEAVLSQLNNLRESVSGVSMDEELANLIKYQKAFQGAAKLINTSTEMMDTVLAMVR